MNSMTSAAAWIKSSYSAQNGGNCIEYAPGFGDRVPVRDSKNPTGPILDLTPGAFAGLVAYAKNTRI